MAIPIYWYVILSVGFSICHLFEEHKGKLWRYFGAIAGVRISDAVGSLVFTVGLGMILLLAGASLLLIDDQASVLGVLGAGFLLGGRVSDWWNSHYSKYFEGYKWPYGYGGNPGLLSSWLYLVDSVLLICLLASVRVRLQGPDLRWLVGGVLTGTVFFLVVIPLIRLVGVIVPNLQEPRWEPTTPPDWALK